MNRGRVECSYNKLDRIMFKGVKLTKKTVLGIHQAALVAAGLAFKIGEIRVHTKEMLNTKEGKIALKRASAAATAVFMVAGGAGAIAEVSQNIPEVQAAVVEEANDLDLDQRYGEYDITSEATQDNMDAYAQKEQDSDRVVTILHNADGTEQSQEILTSTAEKLDEAGIDYNYANDNDELINEIKDANASGEKVSIVSVESGKNNNNESLISAQFVRGQDENSPKTNSQILAEEIVDNNPNRLYTDNGVASDIVEGERQAGIAQQAIISERLEGEKIPVDTLITVRPSSQDVYSPDGLGGDIAGGITEYYSENENTEQKVHSL